MFVEGGKTETKADVFSLESLIAWLEKQPVASRYDFRKWDECLLARWLQESDPTACVAQGQISGFFYSACGEIVDLEKFQPIAAGNRGLNPDEWTFGAALERARKLL